MKRVARLQGVLHISQKPSFGLPSRGALLQGPLHGIPHREMTHHYSPPSFIYQSPLHTNTPSPHSHIPGSPQVVRGPHGQKCPYPETFLTYLPGSPVKELPSPPPRPPSRSLFRERRFICRAPFIHLSKPLVDEPSSRFPRWGHYGKRCPSPEPFLHILQVPQQGSPPSRFPSQSFHRERHSTPRAPFNHISKSPVDEPTPGHTTEPPRGERPIPRAFPS